jgi:Neutral/alkaline non-lysosomal ceramidase, N-terminal
MDGPSPKPIVAGAASCDISPTRPMFLYGYPFVDRISTGIHDPLLASALYLGTGSTAVLFIANDVIFIPKTLADRARKRIADTTGVPADNVMVTATHTHSGPVTTRMLSNESDPVVPEPDTDYLKQLEDGIVAAAERAYRNARPAKIGLGMADGSGLGGNRHDPKGTCDARVPVLSVRSVDDDSYIGLMVICSMHPTVLHEDSTVVSGDFPGLARQYLQQNAVGPDCPVIYHMGAAGNQSPRHFTRSNTLDEAERLGDVLGGSIAEVLPSIQYQDQAEIECQHASLDLPLRSFPSVAKAESDLDKTRDRLKHLRETGAAKTEVRSAECDWFGAEETATLARAADSDRLAKAAAACMPAGVQVIRVGPWSFVGWPGEVFVEFALEVKERFPKSFVITLANGDLEGYLVTQEAIDQATYESGNAVFKSPDSGRILVEATADMLQSLSE